MSGHFWRFCLLFLITFFVSLVCGSPSKLLQKRASGRGTWFEVGLGACGEYSVDTDKIVALSWQIYEDGAHCNQQVTISCNGVTTTATVVDECMGCSAGDLDMSPSLFEEFADLGVGVLSIDWQFI